MLIILELSLKARREQELKIHEQLYSNIQLLTLVYPQSEECKRVFVKDMFVKNNKAAFQQIVYYLLNILDPEATKTKIPWPLLDSKREAQFRNFVIKRINELNSHFDFANIPLLMTSHLISPGGYRFAKFILKLSQLVMSVHLQKDSDVNLTFLFPIRPNKNESTTKACIERLNRRTKQINAETLSMDNECDAYVAMIREESGKILNDKKVVKEKLNILRNNRILCSSFDTESYYVEMSHLNESLTYSSFILQKCLKLKELMSFLFSDEIVLRFNKDTANIPEAVLSTVTVGSSINLLSYFEALDRFLAMVRLRRPNLSTFYVDTNLTICSKTNMWLLMICKAYEELTEKCLRLSAAIETNARNLRSKPSFICNFDDEVLALPLADTPPK